MTFICGSLGPVGSDARLLVSEINAGKSAWDKVVSGLEPCPC